MFNGEDTLITTDHALVAIVPGARGAFWGPVYGDVATLNVYRLPRGSTDSDHFESVSESSLV